MNHDLSLLVVIVVLGALLGGTLFALWVFAPDLIHF